MNYIDTEKSSYNELKKNGNIFSDMAKETKMCFK